MTQGPDTDGRTDRGTSPARARAGVAVVGVTALAAVGISVAALSGARTDAPTSAGDALPVWAAAGRLLSADPRAVEGGAAPVLPRPAGPGATPMRPLSAGPAGPAVAGPIADGVTGPGAAAPAFVPELAPLTPPAPAPAPSAPADGGSGATGTDLLGGGGTSAGLGAGPAAPAAAPSPPVTVMVPMDPGAGAPATLPQLAAPAQDPGAVPGNGLGNGNVNGDGEGAPSSDTGTADPATLLAYQNLLEQAQKLRTAGNRPLATPFGPSTPSSSTPSSSTPSSSTPSSATPSTSARPTTTPAPSTRPASPSTVVPACSAAGASLKPGVVKDGKGRLVAVVMDGFPRSCAGRTATLVLERRSGGPISVSRPVDGSAVRFPLGSPIDPRSVTGSRVTFG